MSKKLRLSLLTLLLLILAVGGVGAWVVLGPNTGVYEGKRSVLIPRGADFAQAADSLDAAGVLGLRRTFRWVAQATGWGAQIKPGHYSFGAGVSNYDILQKLRRGLQDPVRLTIPPGTRPEVIAAVVGRDMAFTPEAFLAALTDSALAAERGVPPDHLYGYMLPETYEVYWHTSPERTVRRILDAFDAFYDRELAAGARQHNLTKDDVVKMAGIVEWETYITDEKPRVAGVYTNRLKRGMKLDADPTVQYAILESEGQKRRLLFVDYKIEHPYNTYRIAGLPPGPINNPSPSSLRAAANPEAHNYLYFVVDPAGNGTHTFSRTLAEHNRAANHYRNEMRRRRAAQRAAE